MVIDCAHGAAYKVAPAALWELGAEVVRIGVQPNGYNINDGCGSTHTEAMQDAVREHGADLGIALDGDADRVLVADEHGELLDGDQLMAMVAEAWMRTGRLKGGGIVATVMSNLGLEIYLQQTGLKLVRTQVGDRYVVETMRRDGFNVGGEQSGHIILNDYNTTGDGLIAAMEVLSVLVQSGKPASEIGRVFTPLPQLLKNVRFNGNVPLEENSVRSAVRDAENKLGEDGRALDPKVRDREADPRHGGGKGRSVDRGRGQQHRRRDRACRRLSRARPAPVASSSSRAPIPAAARAFKPTSRR